MANSTSTGEPTGNARIEILDHHLLDDAVLLEDRHDDAPGLVRGAAGALKDARQRRPDRRDHLLDALPAAVEHLDLQRLGDELRRQHALAQLPGCAPGAARRPRCGPAPGPTRRTTVNSSALSVSGCSSSSWAKVPRSSRNTSSISPVASERMRTEPPSSESGRSSGDEAADHVRSSKADDPGRVIVDVAGVGRAGQVQFEALGAASVCRHRQRKQVARAVRGGPQRGPIGHAQVGLVQQRLQTSGRAPADRRCRRRPAPSRAPAAPGWSRRPARCNRCRAAAIPARLAPGPGLRGSSRWCDPPCP